MLNSQIPQIRLSWIVDRRSIYDKRYTIHDYLYSEAKLCVNVNPLSSIPYVIPSILVVKMLYMMMDIADVPIPSAVLYRASEIPWHSL